jgi:hypothetical protein
MSALTPKKILVPFELEAGWAGLDLEKGIEPRFHNHRTPSLVTIPTELPRFRTVDAVGLINEFHCRFDVELHWESECCDRVDVFLCLQNSCVRPSIFWDVTRRG